MSLETFDSSSSPPLIDSFASGLQIQSDVQPDVMVLPSPRPCAEPCPPQLPLFHDTSGDPLLLPFDPDELSSLPDPMCPDLTIQLGFAVRDVVQTLLDDSLDSQARLLQYIVQFIRTRGLRCTYWFRDKSPKELCAALTRDLSLSAAVRICASKTYSKQYAETLFQIIRHVCRRPTPAYKSSRRVQFAESVQTIDPHTYPGDPSDHQTPSLAPFVADDLIRLHDPFYPNAITHLMLETAFCIQELALPEADGCDTEVHVVRRIFDILLEKELVAPNFLTALDTTALREVLQRDTALWEMLSSLRRLLLRRDTSAFYRNFTLIIRYFGRSLRS